MIDVPKCYGQAVEVRVLTLLDDDMALVDTGVSEETVSVALVDAAVGDWILVHASEAIAKLAGPGLAS